MRLLLTAAIAVILAAAPALAGQGEERAYDREGRYQGRTTEDRANPEQKSVYDASGRYVGRIMTSPATGEARAYNPHGKYLGRAAGGRMPDMKK